MATKEPVRRVRAPKKRKPVQKTDKRRTRAGKLPVRKAEKDLVELVRAGVERFMLRSGTIEDFAKTMQEATERGRACSYRLTRAVFSTIVKDAMKKRQQGRTT